MVSSCSAYGCTKRYKKGDGISFFRFPREKVRLTRWLYAVKRRDFIPTSASRICGRHFLTGKVSHDPEHPDYVPSIFCFSERVKKKRIRKKYPKNDQVPITSIAPDATQSTSTDEMYASSSCGEFSGSTDQKDHLLVLDVSPWPSKKSQSTVPIIFLRPPPTTDVHSSALKQTFPNRTDQIQPEELSDASSQDADQMQPGELSDASSQDADPINESCNECLRLKGLVEKMRIQIAGLEVERKFYREKSILLAESSEECSNTKELLKKMDIELNTLRTERDQYKEQACNFTEQLFKNPKMLYFYTGLNRPTIDWLLNFAKRNEPADFQFMSVETQVLVTLIKLRLGLIYQDLAYRFKTSLRTANRAFNVWLPLLGPRLCSLKQGKGDEIHFPRYLRKSVKYHLKILEKGSSKKGNPSDCDSERTMSADEESVVDPMENVVVELMENSLDGSRAAAEKTDNGNFIKGLVGNSNEASDATKSLEQILNHSSKGELTDDPAEELDANDSLEQIVGDRPTEGHNVNTPNIFYIINPAEKNESSERNEDNNIIEINDKTDSTEDPANNCTEVYYIINTTEGIDNSDSAEQPSDSNLPEDVIFLI